MSINFKQWKKKRYSPKNNRERKRKRQKWITKPTKGKIRREARKTNTPKKKWIKRWERIKNRKERR